MTKPKSVQVRLKLPLVDISGTWEPSEIEQQAAWELYIELITRVGVVGLPSEQGLLREAMNSIYSIFASTRELLKKYGPAIARPKKSDDYNLALLAVSVLNAALRPFLTKWHPQLEDWESKRGHDVSRLSHESSWIAKDQFRADLVALGEILHEFAEILADASGVEHITLQMMDETT